MSSNSYTIEPCANSKEAQDLVCQTWLESWSQLPQPDPEEELFKGKKEAAELGILKFLERTKNELCGQIFLARDSTSKKVVGSICCQLWEGPVPIEAVNREVLCLGTVWGLQVSATIDVDKIKSILLRHSTGYLGKKGCHKVLALDLHETGADLNSFTECGFGNQNMLTIKLDGDDAIQFDSVEALNLPKMEMNRVTISAEGCEADPVVVTHWKKMWLDVGIPEGCLVPEMKDVTNTFIEEARGTKHYQTFVARSENGEVIGSISCQVWDGPVPLVVKDEHFRYGTIWAVYVDPKYRRNGIATTMMKSALSHLQKIGCHRAVLVAASEAGQRVYERLGFGSKHAFVCEPPSRDNDQTNEQNISPLIGIEHLESKCDVLLRRLHSHQVDCERFTPKMLLAMTTATDRQLKAVFDQDEQKDSIIRAVVELQLDYESFVDPESNWFTKHLKRLGKGFDMKKLRLDSSALSSKFDRLSDVYDHWTVGNQSMVEYFTTAWAKLHLPLKRTGNSDSVPLRILDVAAGIGLQGQTLRMCGFGGELVGFDVSKKMVSRMKERGSYDSVFVADANSNFCKQLSDVGKFDISICTGAMELLDQKSVLENISKVLKPGGELWVSFQHESNGDDFIDNADDNATISPTEHQGVNGISEAKAREQLSDAGFEVTSLEICPNAFYTPSPCQSGNLNPVPYMFIVARRL